MCGIFGITINQESQIDEQKYSRILTRLFLLSESRGKEASGFAVNDGKEIIVHKAPFPASKLIKTDIFKKNTAAPFARGFEFLSAIGHSRLVTDGYEQYNQNNQPVIKKGIVAIHNGIIINQRHLWEKFADEKRTSDLDSELLPTLLRRFYLREHNLSAAVRKLFAEIYGTASTAMLFADLRNILLATNNGSLYYISNCAGHSLLFASERYILQTLVKKEKLSNEFSLDRITQLRPMNACLIKLMDVDQQLIRLEEDYESQRFDNIQIASEPVAIREISSSEKIGKIFINTSLEHARIKVPKEFEIHVRRCQELIASLKRCGKCLLPETFPFISFDDRGTCNYCTHYRPIRMLEEGRFRELCMSFRSFAGKPDCIVPFSGGRDSSFALHYLKRDFGMNPIAYSYDWGMLTDLARRNQARMCGKLGVEHILVSADIRKKRANIRRNVQAWLKHPHLGTVPLFMAGDKQYFYFAKLLMKQNNIRLSILGENLFETTNFKSGFCGIKPNFDKNNTYALSLMNKFKLMAFYGKEYFLNPSYINRSLFDTLDAFRSYYLIKHLNINIYNYIRWDEERILKILINEYDWETDPETRATWRIGDGTAAFYNYIYYTIAGFTENDTFRSNQIREGMLSREKALNLVNEENKPRFDSIKWYCDTIQIDFFHTIKTINKIVKLYEK